MLSLLLNSRFETNVKGYRRGLALLTMVAMLGIGGNIFAATQADNGVQLQSPGHAKKVGLAIEDGPAASATNVPTERPAAGSPTAVNSPLAPPVNDVCSGAVVIPAGTYPVVSAPVDVTDATPQGTNDPDVCTAFGVDHTIWFSFTPVTSGQYIFSTCAGSGATGTTVYDTVIGVLDACPPVATTLGCNDTGAGCVAAPGPGAPYVDQGIQAAVLVGGQTYYIAAGHFTADTAGSGTGGTGKGVAPGLNQISVRVTQSAAPSNDTCSAPTPLPLNRIVQGTTASATNDYRSPTACFTGVGQIPSSSNGLDIVFSFTPPSNGKYSFRYVQDDASAALRSQSPVLYLADNCPAPNPAAAITGCIAAANRMNDQTTGNGNRSEEIKCVSLTGGTPYYLFFDDRFTANAGGPMAVEATPCSPETEPNDTPATATVYAPNSSCFMEGSSITAGPAADIDFYDLGAPPAGSKLFVAIDSAASNNSDYEMRITNATDTLGYDDNDGTSIIGSNAPILAGPIADGSEIYARVNTKPVSAGNEPYNLYARIETGVAQNEDPETQPAGAVLVSDHYLRATHVTGGGFVKGIMATQTDEDCFQFAAHEGDNIAYFSDNNPARLPGTITNVWPVLQLINSNPPPANSRFVGQVVRNNVTPSPGTLTGVTPSVTSEFSHYRARYTGAYVFCYRPTQDNASTENPAAAAYPLPWQGSLSINCGPIPGPTPADVSITKTGPVGPVNTGAIISYTITITNNDAIGIAEDIEMVDNLPAGLTFVGLNVNDGFGGSRNAQVKTLPAPGTNNAPIDIVNVSIAPGASVVYTLTVQVTNCSGAGQTIVNTASISSYTLDVNLANNIASWSFTTSEDGSCQDLICSNTGCISNTCTVNDHCSAGSCVSDARDCNDHSVCTADSCDPTRTTPCINDSSQLGDLCNDGNDCTFDTCDPVAFCVFPPRPSGTTCNDFLNCTTNDKCDGAGTCAGHSVCDDGLPCTDDVADEANACACTHDISFPGTFCDDANVCTTGTTCDGTGGTVASCTGGTPALNCNDNNPCTDDSCDAIQGCVHTNNTAACSDGNACTVGDTCGGGTCNSGAAAICNDNNVCTTDSCAPATGCVFTNNTIACDDNSACTAGDTCGGGSCQGTAIVCSDGNACNGVETCNPATGCVAGTPLVCNDNNVCTTDSCIPASGCAFTNNTNVCDDGEDCTVNDVCSGGVCAGTSAPVPAETQNVNVAANKTTYSWSATPFARRYDVVRGSTGALPVGPGGADEVCFDNLTVPTLTDAAVPAVGSGFWYLSRAENACGTGTYGTQGVHGVPGAPRATATCP